MKKLLMSALGVAYLMAGPAIAADIPVKAPPQPVPSWTNCHVGGFVGITKAEDTRWFLGRNNFGFPVPSPLTAPFDPVGAIGGGTVGCDYQFGSPFFVIGVEGDIGWTNLHSSVSNTLAPSPGNHIDLDQHWLATARGRIGFLTGWQGLLYVTGGGAWTSLRGAAFAPAFFTSTSQDINRSGWTAGAGYEARFTQNWSLKFEYLFVDLGTARFFGVTNPTAQGDVLLRLREHVVKLGLNYRFDWGAPAVAARY